MGAMACVLIKTLVVAGMIAWARLGWRYHLLILFVFAFPAGGPKKNDAPPDAPHKITADSSERTIRHDVPLGMPLADARRVLEKKGFKCRLSTDKDGSQRLYCRIWEPRGFLVSYVRKVTLDIKAGMVSKVWFAEGGLGP